MVNGITRRPRCELKRAPAPPNRLRDPWSTLPTYLLIVALIVGAFDAEAGLPEAFDADDPDRIAAAVDEVILESQTRPSAELLLAAAAALEFVGVDEAAFLYHAGRLRALVDLRMYPPARDTNPMVLLSSLSARVAHAVDPVVTGDHAALVVLATRLNGWTPAFPPGYDPGWDHEAPVSGPARNTLVQESVASYVESLRDLGRLLGHPDYRDAMAVVRARNFGERPIAPVDYDAAVAVMRRVEADFGVRGYAPGDD